MGGGPTSPSWRPFRVCAVWPSHSADEGGGPGCSRSRVGMSLGQRGPHPTVATLPAILSPLPPVSPASGFSQWGALEGLLGVTVKQRPKGGALEGLMAPSTPGGPSLPSWTQNSRPAPHRFSRLQGSPSDVKTPRVSGAHLLRPALCQVRTVPVVCAECGTPRAQPKAWGAGPDLQGGAGRARNTWWGPRGAAGGFREDFLEGAGLSSDWRVRRHSLPPRP